MFATLNSLRDANLSGNNKLGQRQEELECVQTIFRCLLQFTQLVDAHGAIPEHETDPSSSKKTENQAVDGTTTIFHAHASPLSPTSNPITSHDVIELLDLFVALLAKDPSPGRMYALVFDPRYDMIGIALALVQVGTRTEGSVAKLMAQHGAQTLTRIMSYCTAEDLPQTECTPSTSVQVSSLTDCAWTSMKTYSGASLLTEQLMQLDRMCWPDLRTSIAECLFVYVMRVAQGSDDLTSSVRPLLSIIAQEEQCELVQNYVTGVLRVTAEKHPQAFVDGWVFLQIAHVLSSTVAPYIRTLLLDVCLVVHQYHPAFFHHTVLLDSVFITTLITVAQTILTDSIYQVPNHTEPQEALCRLIVRACHTEISMPFAETDACASLAAVSLTAEFCALLLHTTGDLAPLKLRTLRWAVCACTTDWMLEVLLGATSMILPICVHVLALQPVQAYSVDVQMEIALLLSLILVKHPSVRSRVRQEALRGMREGVRAGGGMGVSKENAPTNYCDGPVLPRLNWGEEVCKRAREQLTQLPVDVLQDLPLVDAMGYALNDPRVFQFRPPVVLAHQAYAPEPPDYSNVFMVEHVATLILQQQGRDSSWLLEARPNPDSNTPNPLTVESPSFIPVTTESSTRTTELNFDERRRILSRGILCVALDMTLGGLELPTAQCSTKHRMSDLDIHPVVASGQPSRWCENTLGAGNVDLSEQGFSSVHQPANFQGKDGRFAAPPSAGPLHRYDGQEEDIREGYRFHTPQHSHPVWIKYGKGFFPRNSKAFPSIDDINAPVVVTTPRSHRGTVVAVPFRVAGPLRNGYFSQPALRASERTNFTPCLTKPGALLESTHLNDSTPQHSLLSKTRSDDRQLVPHDTMSASENDYVDMAILMYLPIIFGKHYNRSANQGPRTRILDGPDGPIVQTLPKCSTQYTWNVDAVQSKDLYRFFLPFRLISMERIEEEVDRIRKLLMRTRKNHVVTPHTARSRRWFLHDMLNYVLPKTELLLKALQNLLATHGTESVVFALRMIRMADEARRNGTSQREIALSRENGERILLGSDEISSVSDPQHSLVNSFAPSSEYTHDAIQFRTLLPMTRPVRMDEDLEAYRMDLVLEDVLRFHGERYKDVLHSGNLSYAVESIQRYFIEEGRRKQRNDAARPQHLVEIEKEIRRLEEQQERDTWENEAAAELEDDVEPEHGMAAQDCTTSGRYLSAGESCLVRRDLADSFCETKVPSSHARGIQDVLHHMGAEHLEYDDFDEKPPRALLEEAQRKRKEETFSVVSEQESRASSGLSSYSYLDYD